MEFSMSLRETGGDGSGKMGRIRQPKLGLIPKNQNSNNYKLDLFDPLLPFFVLAAEQQEEIVLGNDLKLLFLYGDVEVEVETDPVVAVEIIFLERTPRLTIQISTYRGRCAPRIRKYCVLEKSEPKAPPFWNARKLLFVCSYSSLPVRTGSDSKNRY